MHLITRVYSGIISCGLIEILDSNRELVLCNGGCPRLIDQLSRCLDKSVEDGRSDRIKCITCGCILNMANSNGWYVCAD